MKTVWYSWKLQKHSLANWWLFDFWIALYGISFLALVFYFYGTFFFDIFVYMVLLVCCVELTKESP